MIHDSGAFDGPVGNKGVSVYPGRVSADEAFLYNLHQAGTLNKPATQAQHQVKRYLESRRERDGRVFAGSYKQPNNAELATTIVYTLSASPSALVGSRVGNSVGPGAGDGVGL